MQNNENKRFIINLLFYKILQITMQKFSFLILSTYILERYLLLINQFIASRDSYSKFTIIKVIITQIISTHQNMEEILHEQALRPNSHSFQKLNELALIQYKQQNYSRAQEYFEEAIKLEPTSKDVCMAFYYLGNIEFYLKRQHSHQLAMNWYEKAIEARPSFDAPYHSIGVLYKLQKNLTQAIKYFEKCLEMNFKNSLAYYGLGCCFFERQDFKLAQKSFRLSIQFSQNYDSPHIGLGNIYRKKQGDLERAYQQYHLALQINPKSQEIKGNIESLKRQQMSYYSASKDSSFKPNKIVLMHEELGEKFEGGMIYTPREPINVIRRAPVKQQERQYEIIQIPQWIDREKLHINQQKKNAAQDNNFSTRNFKHLQREDIKLQARDEQMVFEFVMQGKKKILPEQAEIKTQLSKWLFKITEKILSYAFRCYLSEQMTFNQAKVYICKQIIKNVFALSSNLRVKQIIHSNGFNFFKFLSEELEKIFEVLKEKYPLNEQLQIPYELQSLINEYNIDKIDAFKYDYFHQYQNKFSLRADENYNDLIMEIINNVRNYSKQYFTQFKNEMTNIFNESLQVKVNMENEQRQRKRNPNQLDSPLRRQSQRQQSNVFRKDRNHKREIQKIKSYTTFSIKSKIPEYVEQYNSTQLSNKYNLPIKHKSILRILTKWCQQLQEKYENPSYYIDNQKLFSMNSNQAFYLSYDIREKLYEQLKKEWQKIQKFKNQYLQRMNFQMEYQLFKHWTKDEEYEQSDCAIFSMKIVENMNFFITQYLNKLIHGLLLVADVAIKKQKEEFWSNRSRQQLGKLPNLLSFKLKDLLRCRLISKEVETVHILKHLLTSDKLQIIRVKNRLFLNTNDILINFFYKPQSHKFGYIGQIQLTVQSNQTKFIKCSHYFNHFIFEIERTMFGSITEICNIWVCFDQKTIQLYAKNQHKKMIASRKRAYRNIAGDRMIKREKNSPFICSICILTIYHRNYVVDHVSGQPSSQKNICALCCLENMQDKQIINMFFDTDQKVQRYKGISSNNKFPRHSLFILKQSKERQKIKYVKIIDIQRTYLIQEKDNTFVPQKPIDLYQNWAGSKKHANAISKLLKNYLIFSLDNILYDHEYFINKIRDYYRGLQVENLIKNCKDNLIVSQKQFRYFYQGRFKLKTQHNQQSKFIFTVPQWLFGQSENIEHLVIVNDSNKEGARFNDISMHLHEEMIADLINRFKRLKRLQFSEYDYELAYFPRINIQGIKVLKCISCKFKNIDNILKNKNLKDLDELVLSLLWCGLQVTLPQDLSIFSKLSRLTLTKMKICNIPDSIQTLTRLKQLNLSYNKLSILPQSFEKLLNLEQLDLSDNSFTEFPEVLSNNANLRLLILSSCKIKIIPKSLEKLAKLQQLQLNYCETQQISAQFRLLQRLKKFKTRKNNIKSSNFLKNAKLKQALRLSQAFSSQSNSVNLFWSLFPVQNCHEVDLSQICCESIIRNRLIFINICILTITKCNLEIFPDLRRCQNLEKLYLNDNKIEEFSLVDVEMLTNLTIFVIDNNPLQKIPQSFQKLKNLEILKMNNCGLQVFPKLKNAKEVYLKDNPISCLPLQFFEGCPNLSILDLTKCKPSDGFLSTPNYFYKLRSLTDLNLSHCGLKQLPTSISGCTLLKQLDISYNQFKQIPLIFSKLTKLKSLSMYKIKFNNFRSNKIIKFLVDNKLKQPLRIINDLIESGTYDNSYEHNEQQRLIVQYLLDKNEEFIHQKTLQKARQLVNKFSFSKEQIQNQFEKPFILEKVYLEAQHETAQDLTKFQLKLSKTDANEEPLIVHESIKNLYEQLKSDKLQKIQRFQEQYYQMKSNLSTVELRSYLTKCQSKYHFFYPQQFKERVEKKKGTEEEANTLTLEQLKFQIGGGIINLLKDELQEQKSAEIQYESVPCNYQISSERLLAVLQNEAHYTPRVKQFMENITNLDFVSKLDIGHLKFQLSIFYFLNIKRIGFPISVSIEFSSQSAFDIEHKAFCQFLNSYEDLINVEKYFDPKNPNVTQYDKYIDSDDAGCDNQ